MSIRFCAIAGAASVDDAAAPTGRQASVFHERSSMHRHFSCFDLQGIFQMPRFEDFHCAAGAMQRA
jgi:hypothetical protein